MSVEQLTIVTNNHERPLFAAHELPAGVVDEWFDYITEEESYSTRFFQYRGSWYDYYEFQLTSERIAAEGWNGIQPQSYFDAIAVRYFDRDGNHLDDTIVVAHIHW